MVFASLMSNEWTFVPTAAPTWRNHGATTVPAASTLKIANKMADRQTKTMGAESGGDVSSTMASVREAGKSKKYWRAGKAGHKNSVYTGEE